MTKFKDCTHMRGGNQSVEESFLPNRYPRPHPVCTTKQDKRHLPFPHSPLNVLAKCHIPSTPRDGNVITAQVSNLLMGLSYVYGCSGKDVWWFDLARELFCMPSTACFSVLSFWFTLQCFNVSTLAKRIIL